MKFTKEEREKLITNGKAIEQYIRTEIMPYLNERVSVPFGDIVRRGQYNEFKECKYCLHVDKNEISASEGGLSLYFKVPACMEGCMGSIDVYDNLGHGMHFLNELCLNWRSRAFIKSVLNTAVRAQRELKQEVFENFEV